MQVAFTMGRVLRSMLIVLFMCALIVCTSDDRSVDLKKSTAIQEALHEALYEYKLVTIKSVNYAGKWKGIDSFDSLISSLRIPCRDRVACEYLNPAIELENVMILDGVFYLNHLDAKSNESVKVIKTFYASEIGWLPSNLVRTTDISQDWVTGPRFSLRWLDNKVPKKCVTTWDTTAFFVHPWEPQNAFHAMNDNILSVLMTITLSYLLNGHITKNITLFKFNLSYVPLKPSGIMYQVLDFLFGDVTRPASDLLKGGPHCIRKVVWSNGKKPFYKDSLAHLRKILYKFLILSLQKNKNFPELSAPELREKASKKSKKRKKAQSSAAEAPRVVIVTRNFTGMGLRDPYRKLSYTSEVAIKTAFEAKGAHAVICCDFARVVTTVPRLLSYFSHADICVGMHGAGLANCVFMRPQGIVMEIQSNYGFGFDSYLKIAQMQEGFYIAYDSRKDNTTDDGSVQYGGTDLTTQHVDVLVTMAMKAHTILRTPIKHSKQLLMRTGDSHSNGYNASGHHHTSRYDKRLQSVIPFVSKEAMNMVYSERSRYQTNNLIHQIPPPNDHVLLHEDNRILVVSPYVQEEVSNSSILGPPLTESAKHCKELPFYTYRLLTQAPIEHLFRCDFNKLFTKSSGRLKARLILDFV